MDDQDKHIHDATGVCLTFKSRHEEQSDGNMLDHVRSKGFATAGRTVYFYACDNDNDDMCTIIRIYMNDFMTYRMYLYYAYIYMYVYKYIHQESTLYNDRLLFLVPTLL